MLKLQLLLAVITMTTLSWTVCAHTLTQTPIVRGDIFVAAITAPFFGVEYTQQGKFIDESRLLTHQHSIKTPNNQNITTINPGGGNSYNNLDGAISLSGGIRNGIADSHGSSCRDCLYTIGSTANRLITVSRLKQRDLSYITESLHFNYGNYYKVASASSGATCLRVPISQPYAAAGITRTTSLADRRDFPRANPSEPTDDKIE